MAFIQKMPLRHLLLVQYQSKKRKRQSHFFQRHSGVLNRITGTFQRQWSFRRAITTLLFLNCHSRRVKTVRDSFSAHSPGHSPADYAGLFLLEPDPAVHAEHERNSELSSWFRAPYHFVRCLTLILSQVRQDRVQIFYALDVENPSLVPL